jgi:hypothetical protein
MLQSAPASPPGLPPLPPHAGGGLSLAALSSTAFSAAFGSSATLSSGGTALSIELGPPRLEVDDKGQARARCSTPSLLALRRPSARPRRQRLASLPRPASQQQLPAVAWSPCWRRWQPAWFPGRPLLAPTLAPPPPPPPLRRLTWCTPSTLHPQPPAPPRRRPPPPPAPAPSRMQPRRAAPARRCPRCSRVPPAAA